MESLKLNWRTFIHVINDVWHDKRPKCIYHIFFNDGAHERNRRIVIWQMEGGRIYTHTLCKCDRIRAMLQIVVNLSGLSTVTHRRMLTRCNTYNLCGCKHEDNGAIQTHTQTHCHTLSYTHTHKHTYSASAIFHRSECEFITHFFVCSFIHCKSGELFIVAGAEQIAAIKYGYISGFVFVLRLHGMWKWNTIHQPHHRWPEKRSVNQKCLATCLSLFLCFSICLSLSLSFSRFPFPRVNQFSLALPRWYGCN